MKYVSIHYIFSVHMQSDQPSDLVYIFCKTSFYIGLVLTQQLALLQHSLLTQTYNTVQLSV